MAKLKKDVAPDTEETPDGATAIAKALMKQPRVYNEYETVYYTVSTGSLALDIATKGGIFPGVNRLVGVSTGGKTSESFQIMQSVFAARPKSRGIYIKAEKFGKNMEERIGVKMTLDPDQWDNHTCLMVECQVYDTVAQFIIDVLEENITRKPEDREQFVIIIDSLDFLILKSDLEKQAGEAHKVAGPQVITKLMLKKICTIVAKFGHICLAISQETSQPKIDLYSPTEIKMFGNNSGGYAIIHAADNIWEFKARSTKDYILENPDERPDNVKNKTLGHNVKIILRKSDNEKYGQRIQYPIKYGQKGGASVWLEREVTEYALAHGFFNRDKKTYTLDKTHQDAIEALDPDFPDKFVGLQAIYQALEESPKAVKYLYDALYKSLDLDDVSEKEDLTE